MDLRALALLAFALTVISLSEEKPVSLTYRCPCRFYESNVARANIKHLKILSTPNCSLQIVARLKSNSKQVCIDPKLKWIQEYLEKALNKQLSNISKLKEISCIHGLSHPDTDYGLDLLGPGMVRRQHVLNCFIFIILKPVVLIRFTVIALQVLNLPDTVLSFWTAMQRKEERSCRAEQLDHFAPPVMGSLNRFYD
ncbi:hypothetical protein BTVI_55636 [Pitangus sulphuratus]|nr:hypothetical protein BTVI_55636 [Pitangus sulphuratus]